MHNFGQSGVKVYEELGTAASRGEMINRTFMLEAGDDPTDF